MQVDRMPVYDQTASHIKKLQKALKLSFNFFLLFVFDPFINALGGLFLYHHPAA